MADGLVESLGEGGAGEQLGPVGGDADVALLQIEQADRFVVLAGAEEGRAKGPAERRGRVVGCGAELRTFS